MRNAVIIDPADNVVVAIEPLAAGGEVSCPLPDGTTLSLAAAEDIPLFHKVARTPIAKGEAVVKYGEYIGVATRDIAAGEHVHTHNCVSTDALKEADAR